MPRILLPRGVRYGGGGRSSDSGLPPPLPSRLPDSRRASGVSAGEQLPSQRRDRPGFAPDSLTALPCDGAAYHRTVSAAAFRTWAPIVLWAAMIFAFSSIPSLGTGLGTWDLVLRKLAHLTEYAVLGALLARALARPELAILAGGPLRHDRRDPPALRPRAPRRLVRRRHRHGRSDDRRRRLAALTVAQMNAVLIDLDGALGDTRPLWDDWLAGASRVLGIDPASLPADRGAAAAALDAAGAGNWRALLERFAAERAPVYLRPNAEVSSALRTIAATGRPIGVYTDAPTELAGVAARPARRRTAHHGVGCGHRGPRGAAGGTRAGRRRRHDSRRADHGLSRSRRLHHRPPFASDPGSASAATRPAHEARR